MPYVSIACIISYVIGHALGPSMYPRAGSMVSLPPPVPPALETAGLSSLERLQGGANSAQMASLPVFLWQRALSEDSKAACVGWSTVPVWSAQTVLQVVMGPL